MFRCLSTFKVGRFGEARAWSGQKIQDMDKKIYKSRVFDQLPTDLSRFERWLPSFKLVESTPLSPVYVILRPKSSATAHKVAEWSKQWQNLPKVWWMSVFIPAIRSLPVDTRTRRFNTVRTFGVTGLLPTYMRLYKEDIVPLDQALNNPMHQLDDFEWFFISYGYGQRKELEEGEPLGPGAFGLSDMFDLTSITKISLHIALNFSFTDRTYSLFWDLEETYRWIQCEFFLHINMQAG